MKRIPAFFAVIASAVCIWTMNACSGTAEDALLGQIEKMDKALAANPDPALADSLVAKCQEWMALRPDDAARQASGNLKAASALALTGRSALALPRLKQILRQYHETPEAPAAALLMAALYKKDLNSPATAFAIYQLFPEAFPQSDKIKEAKSWLPANVEPLPQRIDSMAMRIVNVKTGQLEVRIANDYIETCEVSALLLPTSADAGKMLYKAGEVSRTMGAHDKALEYYEQVCNAYPNDDHAPEALFMQAFTLDNDLKRYDEAKVLYESFIKKYPKDDFADDAQFLLKNLGKSEEEIFQALENR